MANETPVAVSGSATDNTGGKASGLDAAFEAAFESIDPGEDKFATPVKPAGKTDRPVNNDVPENAAPAESGDEDKDDKAVEGKVETPAPKPAPVTSAPAHWDAGKREAFGKLPPEAQKVLLDLSKGLEADATKKLTEAADDRKFATSIKSLISDGHRTQLQRAGMDEVGGIKHLLSLQDFASRDGPGYVRWVTQQMGLDPRQLFPQLAGGEPAEGIQPPPANPQYQQLSEAYQRLNGVVEGFVRQQADTQNRSAARAIDGFRNAVDESGQPKHPHFAKVEADLIWILQSDPAIKAIDDLGERLRRAYDLAVYRDPELKNQIVDGEVQRRIEADRKAADLAKAKRARAPITTAAPVTPAATKPKSLHEATQHAMTSLGVS